MSVHHATLRQLKVFHTLSRELSVTRTAEVLHLTPPAVSIQVKQLAEAVGQPLIEQIGRRIHLTAAGERVAAACRDLFERMDLLEQELAMLKGVEHGRVKVAIITTSKYFMPRLLGRFCRRHPGIDVSLFVGNRDQLLERIRNNEDDLYILGRPPRDLPVVAEVFADNPLVVVAAPNHPLAREGKIGPERLCEAPFLLREPGSGTRLAVLDFFRRHKLEPRIHMELGSNEAIKQCVMAELGVAVLSYLNVQQDHQAGRIALLDVEGFPLKRHWYIIQQRNRQLLPSAEAFKRFLLDVKLDGLPDAPA